MVSGSTETEALIAGVLVTRGVATSEALATARERVAAEGGSVIDLLLRLNLVREIDVLRAFAEFYGTRFVRAETLRSAQVDAELIQRIDAQRAEDLGICPLRFDAVNGELTVVSSIPQAAQVASELRTLVGIRGVHVFVATPGAVAALLRRSYFGEVDAFSLVTANGAGPTLRGDTRSPAETMDDDEIQAAKTSTSGLRTIADLEDTVPETRINVPKSDTDPSAEVTPLRHENATVQVSVEALTIAALRREIARYRVAQEFHRRVTLESSTQGMVDRILAVIFELLNAEGAAIWLVDGASTGRSRDGQSIVEIPKAVIQSAMESRNGVLTRNAQVDARFELSQSVASTGVKSVMAVPLKHREEALGVLYVDSPLTAAFTKDDLPLLDSIGSQAALLLRNAALVAQVQKEVETRASLSRFLSQAAVEEVLSGRLRVDMEGHHAEVTALFVDIRRFTTLSAQLPPRDVVTFLNAFFEVAVGAIERFGGIVDKFVGDSVMGLWGAIEPREDDARNALSAAIEMIAKGSLIRADNQPIEFGVGVSTGPAVVGAIGARNRFDYTAIGATINLAARLCGAARAGEVLATRECLDRSGPGVVAEVNEAVLLKGLDHPIAPYSIKAVAVPLRLTQLHQRLMANSAFGK